MKNQKEDDYPISRKVQDVSNVFLTLNKTLYAAQEFYLQKDDLDDIMEGVASLSRIMHTFTEELASDCAGLEQEKSDEGV